MTTRAARTRNVRNTTGRRSTRRERADRQQLRFLVFQEGEWVAAQCLEYDIATQARTLDDLVHEVQRIVIGHIATSRKLHKAPFERVPQAPEEFWAMFERSKIPLPARPVAFNLSFRLKPQLQAAV